jgi:TRAP-type mannitol/chloroaromatic compound transport system substrate-binding protein
VVPPFQVLDAIHTGTLDGGVGVPAYWFGKQVAFSPTMSWCRKS